MKRRAATSIIAPQTPAPLHYYDKSRAAVYVRGVAAARRTQGKVLHPGAALTVNITGWIHKHGAGPSI